MAELHPVLKLDAKLSSHPIVQTVTTPDEITAIFDTISYSKVVKQKRTNLKINFVMVVLCFFERVLQFYACWKTLWAKTFFKKA